jgi:predicted DsbA family dithiol-disulfide isomerase
VRLGNINNSYFGELPEINIRIEEYSLRTTLGKLEVAVRKIESLRMMKPRSHRKKNNTVTDRKVEKKGVVQKHAHPQLFETLNAAYQKYASNHVETVVLKTFLNVFQQDFDEGEEVPFDRHYMFQKVELVSFDNEREEKQVEEMLEGFPLPMNMLDSF